jgi:hypothetical protein
LAVNAELRYQRDQVVRPKWVAVKGKYNRMMGAIGKLKRHKGEKWREVTDRMKGQMIEEVKVMKEEVNDTAKNSKVNLTYLNHAQTISDCPSLPPVARLNCQT